jgi:hypothetical protein
MKIKNTEQIIINSIKIKGNKKIINYSRHIGQGNYNNCIKAIYYNIDTLNLKWA